MRYALLVFLGACSYGILSTFVKIAYAAGFSPKDVIASQIWLGLLLQIIVTCVAGCLRSPLALGGAPLKPRPVIQLLLTGSMMGLTTIFYYVALLYVPASLAIILIFQFTWIGVLIDALLERTMPGSASWAALLLLFAGTAMAGGVFDGALSGIRPLGILFGLLSAITYSLFILFSGRAAPGVTPFKRSMVMTIGSLLVISAFYPPGFLGDGSLYKGLLLWGGLLALFGAVIPTLFFAIGVPKTGGGLATILGAAELPTSVVMSWIVLGEAITPFAWTGVAVILAGIVLPEGIRYLQSPRVRRKDAPQP